MGCKRYDGPIICVLFQISWQLQTQIVKNRILSDSLLGNKLYINCWLPVYRWSVMDKQVTSTPPIPGNGGVLVTCIYITDHL